MVLQKLLPLLFQLPLHQLSLRKQPQPLKSMETRQLLKKTMRRSESDTWAKLQRSEQSGNVERRRRRRKRKKENRSKRQKVTMIASKRSGLKKRKICFFCSNRQDEAALEKLFFLFPWVFLYHIRLLLSFA